MENFAETSVGYENTTKGLVVVPEKQMEGTVDFPLLGDNIKESKQNFDFGAELVKTKSTLPTLQQFNEQQNETLQNSETEIKTNPTNISTINVGQMETLEKNINVILEDPLHVVEVQKCTEPNQKVQPILQNSSVDLEVKALGMDYDNEDEEEFYDGEDSSQSEADDEHVQKRMTSRSMLDYVEAASQESDESTSDSNFSDLSGLSDMSGREWKPNTRPINWVQKQIHSGANPRDLLSQMLPSNAHQIAPGVNDMTLWRILASLISEPPRRQKLRYINTFEDVVELVLQSQNIIVLTGAGVSVSCGIPDFRSSDGIYSRLAKDYPDLPDPQAMFDINYFSRDPRPFYKFAREIYPGQFKPSPCHRFIKLLEDKKKLLRNYTQNIDTLEQEAGIRNVIECHGSFSTASCTKCKHKCHADDIRRDIFAQRIPVCPRCQPNVQQSVDASEPVSELELKQLVENGIMKPDIVFFGEGLPQEFHTVMASDKDQCDLLIVMGSSLKVRPVALIPSSIPAHVPQILINREQLHHLEFDVELLGDSDVIINQLCHRLANDWEQICYNPQVLKESKELLPLVEEDTATEGEEEAQQLQDTDTQSIKSNESSDIALRSAGAYLDSGFESSTSSGAGVSIGVGVVVGPHATVAGVCDATSMPQNDFSLADQAKNVELLPPLDELTDAVDYANPEFQSLSEQLERRSVLSTENYRHMSIDSSKDSGIQCDSSNSALVAASASALLPPMTSFGDSGGTSHPKVSGCNAFDSTSALQQPATETAQRPMVPNNPSSNKTTVGCSDERELKRQQQKRQSAAERLVEGTYYSHESSSSYVFPGAQVSWCSDTEEEEDEEEEEDNEHYEYEEDDMEAELNVAPLSPLLPPSVEAEIVNEITTTNTYIYTTTSTKRAAADSLTAATTTTSEHASCTALTRLCNTEATVGKVASNESTVSDSAPPTKRRRDSTDNSQLESTKLASSNNTTTYITTTINTGSDSSITSTSGNSLEVSSAREKLLQQF